MRRTLLAIVALLLVAIGAWLALQTDRHAGTAIIALPDPVHGPDKPPVSAPVEIDQAGSAPGQPALDPSRGARVSAFSQPEERIAVHAKVRAFGRHGVRYPRVDGYITWELVHVDAAGEETYDQARADLHDDVWTLNCPVDVKLSLRSVTIEFGNRLLSATADRTSYRPGDIVDATLDVHFDEGVRIDVVDATTGAALMGVEACLVRPGLGDFVVFTHPPIEVLRGGRRLIGASPLWVEEHARPASGRPLTGWARAQGYAWRRFTVAGTMDRVRVDLERGSNVTVHVRSRAPLSPYASLNVFGCNGTGSAGNPLSSRPSAVRSLGSSTSVRLTGLRSGLAVFAVVGHARTNLAQPRLGSLTLDLEPGTDRTVVIDLDDPSSQLDVGHLAVTVPDELWSGRLPNLASVIVEGHTAHESPTNRSVTESPLHGDHAQRRNGARQLIYEGLPAGDYGVILNPLGLVKRVSVEAGQLTRVVFEPLPRVDVPLTFLLASGDPFKWVEVLIRPTGESSGHAWHVAGMLDDRGEVTVRTPAGPIDVHLRGGLGFGVIKVHAVADMPRIVVRLDERDRYEFEVAIERDGQRTAVDMDLWYGLRVEPVGGQPIPEARTSTLLPRRLIRIAPGRPRAGAYPAGDATHARVTVQGAGRYRLTFPHVPGQPSFGEHVVVVGGPESADVAIPWPTQ